MHPHAVLPEVIATPGRRIVADELDEHLPRGIDRHRSPESVPVIGKAQVRWDAQIAHDTMGEEERVITRKFGDAVHNGRTYDLARVIDVMGTTLAPAERTQVVDAGTIPEEGVVRHIPGDVGVPDHLTPIVDRGGDAGWVG